MLVLLDHLHVALDGVGEVGGVEDGQAAEERDLSEGNGEGENDQEGEGGELLGLCGVSSGGLSGCGWASGWGAAPGPNAFSMPSRASVVPSTPPSAASRCWRLNSGETLDLLLLAVGLDGVAAAGCDGGGGASGGEDGEDGELERSVRGGASRLLLVTKGGERLLRLGMAVRFSTDRWGIWWRS
ncbi:MAG: hypothetical protein GC160_16210 [Acidobacteria bacterium]|nr:hypothetical protein [Acidobacteriota bacterium]